MEDLIAYNLIRGCTFYAHNYYMLYCNSPTDY